MFILIFMLRMNSLEKKYSLKADLESNFLGMLICTCLAILEISWILASSMSLLLPLRELYPMEEVRATESLLFLKISLMMLLMVLTALFTL